MASLKRLFYDNFFKNKVHANKYYSVISHIKSKIHMTGPITVAEYMREALTNPKYGYYMKNDVFGKQGDFITSPEISQLFGELLAIWTVAEWEKLGKPNSCQLVELGPGRGTLLQDILRVYSKLGSFPQANSLSVHLVEVSRAMSEIQFNNLCTTNTLEVSDRTHSNWYQKGLEKHSAIPIYWYSDIRHVPKHFSILIAHEFFDALPVHKFQKVGNQWREILVDINEEKENELKFVVSRNPTPASLLFTKEETERTHFEISPQAALIMEQIGINLEENGGFALIIDYGHEGEKSDTFRAFRQHNLHDPLVEPGTADLTADVDFSYLRKAVNDKLLSVGPVSQNVFLSNMHIDIRLKMLLKKCQSEDEKEVLISGYNMIMDQDKMGERFKLMSFFPLVLSDFLQRFPVAGFG